MILKKIKSFTLLEVLIVIVIVGILAGFALPKFGRAFAKLDERSAIANLIATRTAGRMYLANTLTTVIPNWGNIAAINTALGLSIMDAKMTYACTAAANGCSATHPSGWILEYHFIGAHSDNGSIHCTDASCPSCPIGGGGNCG